MYIRATIAVASLLAVCGTSSAGLQFTWNGAGADALWTNTDNWIGNNAPPFDVGGNDIIFGSTGGIEQSPDIDGNSYTQISSIAYLGADASLTLVDNAGGGSLSFVNGGTLTNNSALLQTIDVDLVGTFDGLFITSIGGGDFDILGDIDLSHTGGVELTVGGAFDTLLAGVISGSGGSLRKISDGVLTLTGANTFDGGTELAGGAIVLGDDSALGTGALSVTGDAALRSDDDLRAIDNDVSIADAVSLTFSGGNGLALNGDLSGAGSLVVDADDDDTALTLGGDNTHAGGTTLLRGTIVLGNDNALGPEDFDVAGDGSIQSDDDARVIGNRIRILEDVTLTFSGTNDLELSERLFNAGSLLVNADADDVTLALTGASTYSGGTTLMRGTVLLGNNGALGTGAVTVAGDSSIQSNANNRRIDNEVEIADTVSLTFSGGENLELGGVISGDGSLVVDADGGNDRLVLSGENTYTGGTLLNRGSITIGNDSALGTGDLTLGSNAVRLRSTDDDLAIDNAIDTGTFLLTFAGNQGLTINGDISGSGGLRMNGAGDPILTLNGANTYTGDTTVDGGSLLLGEDASLTSDVLVNDGATFGGSGSVTGDLTVAGGATVAPGIGVGTLTLDGNYVQESDATLSVELDSMDLATFDAIDATGTATLEDGARIDASISGDGYIPTGQLFEILQADGGITQAGDVTVTFDSATVTVDLVRDQDFMNNDITWSLELARAADAYSAAANPGNNRAIASGLDGLIGPANLDPEGDAGDLLGVLDSLAAEPYNEVVAQLSPQPYWVNTALGRANVRDFTTQQVAYLTGVRTGIESPPAPQPVVTSMAMLASGDPLLLATAKAQQEDAPADPTAAPPPTEDRRWGRYAKVHGEFSNQDTTADLVGYSGRAFGAQFGIDYSFTTDFVAGLAIGYTYSNADVEQDLGSLDDHALRFGPYMSYASGNWYLDGSATAAYHLYRGDRNVPLLSSVAESDYDGWDFTGYLGTGYHFNPTWNLHVTPMGSLLYTHFAFSGFTESGASGANLTLPDRSDDSLRSRLGVNVSYRFPNLGWQPIVYGYAGWEHEFFDNNNIEASFAAGGNPFTIILGSADRDAIFYGGGLNLLVNDDVALFFRLEALTGDNGDAVGAAGGVSVAF